MKARSFCQDKEGRVVLGQWPNMWIIIWAATVVLRLFNLSNSFQHLAYIIGSGTLVIWALLEIFQGVNYFRRALGLMVLMVTLASIFKAAL